MYMKTIKTYEGFFDFLKKKRTSSADVPAKAKSADDVIVEDYMKRLEHLKGHLEKGKVSPYDILINTEGTEEGVYYTRYRFMFDDSPIRISKVEADGRKYRSGWNIETQKSYMEQGAVKKNNHVFYLLLIENADEAVNGDVGLLEDLHELADWCYKKNKENRRIDKIRGNMNPAADLLDDDIWGGVDPEHR